MEKIEEKFTEYSVAYELLHILKQANKRLWIALILLLGLVFVSNGYWIYTFTQYDFTTYSYEMQAETDDNGDATNIYNDGGGDVSFGTSTPESP